MMDEMRDVQDSPEKRMTKAPEKNIDTFDDLRNSDNSGIGTFDDIRKQNSDGIRPSDNLRKEVERGDIKAETRSFESEGLSNSSAKLSFTEGRHRAYVAVKEGYNDIPVKLNDVYTQEDGGTVIDNRDITHVNIDKDVLNSEDMQNMMKEHDFEKWEKGLAQHKGFTYNDHIKEFDRLKECQEFVKTGHSEKEIETLLGKGHAETYRRFYETRPIKVDRIIEKD